MPTEYREYVSNYSGEEIDKYLSYVESNENTLNFEPYRRLTNNTYLNSPITEENEENLLLAFPGNKTEAYILYSANGPLLLASKLRIRQTSGGYLTYISYTYGTHTYIRSVDDGLIDVNEEFNNKVNDMYEGTSNLYRAFLHPSAINEDVSITPITRHNTQSILIIANEDERETEISTEPLIVMTKDEIEKSSNRFNWLYLSIRDNGFQPLTPFFELSYNFEFILDENAYDYEVFTRGDETEEGVIDHTCLRFELKANIPETADTNVYIKSTLPTDTIGTMDFYPFIKKYETGDEINAPEYTTVTPTINEVYRDVPLLSSIRVSPNLIDECNKEISSLKKEVSYIEDKNGSILVSTKLAKALLNSSGGEAYSESYFTTDFIPVNKWEIYEIIGSSASFTLHRCLYNSNKQLIGYVTVTASDYKRRYDVTPDVSYMRWSWSKFMQDSGIEIRKLTHQQAYYEGEKIQIAKRRYETKPLFHSGSEPSNPFKSFQGFALNNDVLFQCLGDDGIKTYDFKTGNPINVFSAETGHGGSAYFSNEYYQQTDDFPLMYVATGDITGSIYTYTNALRVTQNSAQTIRSYRFEKSVVGNGANSCVDFSQNIMYVVGYYGDIDTPEDNHLILTAYDLDSTTQNSDGTLNPTKLWTKQLPFVYVVQSTNYINGQIWMLSSDSSGSYEAKIYVYSIEKNEFISKIGFPDLIKYGEVEDIEFVERTTKGQYDVLTHSRTNNWNYILMSFD